MPLPVPVAGGNGVYRLKRRPPRRTLALHVSEAGEVAVNAPLRLSQAEVDRFLLRHADWLRHRLDQQAASRFQWRGGAELPWRGGRLRLVLLPPSPRPAVRREGERLLCAVADAELAAAVGRWYRHAARDLLAERLSLHAVRLDRPCPPLRLSNARSRWGSLSPAGVVGLNWRLVKASTAELDYVICHELAHFRRRDHSPAFWAEVERLYPDWDAVRRSLRQNGPVYFQF